MDAKRHFRTNLMARESDSDAGGCAADQDMPILGYGKSSLAHDRLYSFHNTLSGHSLNYISRGTYWGTEQRQALDHSVGNGTPSACHSVTRSTHPYCTVFTAI